MNLSSIVDIAAFLAGLTAVVVGVGMKDIGWALVTGGSIVLGLLVLSRMRGGKKE